MDRPKKIKTTMLDLIMAVGKFSCSEKELVEVIRHMVNSGRIKLTGNFKDSKIAQE